MKRLYEVLYSRLLQDECVGTRSVENRLIVEAQNKEQAQAYIQFLYAIDSNVTAVQINRLGEMKYSTDYLNWKEKLIERLKEKDWEIGL